MVDWPKLSDDKLFGDAREQESSDAAYPRKLEIQRRLYIAQKETIAAQRAAVAEMRAQSRYMLVSVIGAFATALITLGIAFLKH